MSRPFDRLLRVDKRTTHRNRDSVVKSFKQFRRGSPKKSGRRHSGTPSDVRKRSALPSVSMNKFGAAPQQLGVARNSNIELARRAWAFRISHGIVAPLKDFLGKDTSED